MSREIKALVVLPPGYRENQAGHYPVLYALHGKGASYAAFSEMRPLLESLREHPMLVASFDCDDAGFYIDSTTRPDSQFTTFFFDEFLPYMDNHYRTRTEAEARGATGFSMGGYGALQYTLTHPDMFGSVSCMSTPLDRDFIHIDTGKTLAPLVSLLGPFEENRAAYSKIGIHDRIEEYLAKGVQLPPIFLHCAVEDSFIDDNRVFLGFLIKQNQKLKAAGKGGLLEFQYKESPGKHDWAFWRDASAGIADFHWRFFQRGSAGEHSLTPPLS